MSRSRRKLLAVLGALISLAFAAPGPVPAPWTAADIGGPGVAGSSTYDPVTMGWAVTGGGGDIWGGADQFQYASEPVTGDCTITARVITQGNADVWSKAGVMIRETNAAGASFAMAAVTPGNGVIVQWRTATNAGAAWPGASATGTVPMWVRLNRTGNLFTGYYSTNGTTWTANGNVTITMAAAVMIGLEVTSHNNGTTSACTFDNVTITDGSGVVVWPLAPPTNLTATNGINSVTLNWTASVSAATTGYTVLRGTTTGGPYTALPGGTTAGTTFTDNTAANPNTYFYVVVATNATIGQSAYSNEVTGIPNPPPVSATPNTGLVTNENGLTATFDIKFNLASPAGGSLVTVSTSNAGEGIPSTTFAGATANATGFTVVIPQGQTPTITVLVTGIDDQVVDPATAYQVNVSSSNWVPALTIPPVQLTNNDNDSPGFTVTSFTGPTTESGGTASISVVLNTIPSVSTSITASSSNPAEAIITSALPLVFTNGNWNIPQSIVLTGVDDTVLDFDQPFTVTVSVSGGDPNYTGLPPQLRGGFNADDEQIPTLPTVWGKGGCGLTGLEVVLLLGLGAAWRRRRNS